jgi:hypothetical protein
MTSTQVQWRRGTAAQHTAFTGAVGEVTVNLDTHQLHVHDGTTPGGFATGGAAGFVTEGHYGGNQPPFTPASTWITFDKDNGRQWNWYNGQWN